MTLISQLLVRVEIVKCKDRNCLPGSTCIVKCTNVRHILYIVKNCGNGYELQQSKFI